MWVDGSMKEQHVVRCANACGRSWQEGKDHACTRFVRRRQALGRRQEKGEGGKCACRAPHALLLCRRRTPSYAYALLLLMLLEVALIWRLYPYSAPIGPVAA